jgi:hypothetical protein
MNDPSRKLLALFHQFGVENHEEMIGRCLDLMFNLRSLMIPSAPATNFFARSEHPLQTLHVQSGYDSQHFLQNLAHATCFSGLKELYFEDHGEFLDGWEQLACQPNEYKQLFAVSHFADLWSLTLVNATPSREEW